MRFFKSMSTAANPAATTKEVEILESRLKDIDQRRDQIETRLAQLAHVDLSFEAQELSGELRELNALRNVTDTELRALRYQPSAEQITKAEEAARRRERYIDSAVRERKEVREAFIARLESCGDWHQAKVHRMALLGLRQEVENELRD